MKLPKAKRWIGNPISESGVYSDIDIDKYHQDKLVFDGFSISSTGLKKMVHRPAEYWCESIYNPDRFTPKESPALNFGKAAHCLLLGDEDFESAYAVKPEMLGNKKWHGGRTECKEWLADKAASGITVISAEEFDHIRYMHDSLSSNPSIKAGLLDGAVENTLCGKHNKIWMKYRPDVMPPVDGVIVDLKTAMSVDDEALSRAVFNQGYHVAAGLADMVTEIIVGEKWLDSFFFVFVEKSPPYEVRIKELLYEDLVLGRRQAEHAMQKLEQCIKTATWPGIDGVDQAPTIVELPYWGRKRIEETLNREETNEQ